MYGRMAWVLYFAVKKKKIAPGLNVLIFFYVIGRQKLALLPQPIRDTKLPLIPSRSLAFLAVQ